MAPPLSAGGSPVGLLSWPRGNQARRRFARNSKVDRLLAFSQLNLAPCTFSVNVKATRRLKIAPFAERNHLFSKATDRLRQGRLDSILLDEAPYLVY